MASGVPSKFDGQQEASRFSQAQGCEEVDPVVVHPTANTRGTVESAARYWSCVLAFHQALLELDGEGLAIAYLQRDLSTISQSYTTNVGGGGQSGGWRLDQHEFIEIRHVLKPEWAAGEGRGVTADGDIFALSAGLSGADEDVREAAVGHHRMFTAWAVSTSCCGAW